MGIILKLLLLDLRQEQGKKLPLVCLSEKRTLLSYKSGFPKVIVSERSLCCFLFCFLLCEALPLSGHLDISKTLHFKTPFLHPETGFA